MLAAAINHRPHGAQMLDTYEDIAARNSS